jgi:hypothetical protein
LSGGFLNQYNAALDEAEAQIDAIDYLTRDEVKKFFADKNNHNTNACRKPREVLIF